MAVVAVAVDVEVVVEVAVEVDVEADVAVDVEADAGHFEHAGGAEHAVAVGTESCLRLPLDYVP